MTFEPSGERCACESNHLACKQDPKPGCFCPTGYYEYEGKCILNSNCQSDECTGLKIYQESGEKCLCDPEYGVICSVIEIPGCYCPYPFYEDKKGHCIPISECPTVPVCPENMEHDTQGESCVCDKKLGLLCEPVVKDDCYCKDTYYKDQNNNCTLKESCKVDDVCPGEVYQDVGETCLCHPKKGLVCVPVNKAQCYCPENYYRDIEGECISKETCVKQCKDDQVFKDGGEQCSCKRGQLECKNITISACYCPEDSYRNKEGVCVPKSSCVDTFNCPEGTTFAQEGEKCLCDKELGKYLN